MRLHLGVITGIEAVLHVHDFERSTLFELIDEDGNKWRKPQS